MPVAATDQACVRVCVIYSSWCIQCRYLKPMAARLAAEHQGQVKADIVPADSAEGKALRERYGVRGQPCALMLDANGRLLAGPRCGPLSYPVLEEMLAEAARSGECALAG